MQQSRREVVCGVEEEDVIRYDIAGFVVGVKEKALKLPDKDSMQHGDVLIGLLSSGVHSNGFSLVRKIAEISGVKMTDPAPYDPTTTLGVSLLTPTKIYVKTILELVRLGPGILKGVFWFGIAAHITGGGLFQNIPRMLPESVQAVIRADTWDLPAVFRWCVTQGKLDCTELASTFNVGIGMVLCVGIEHKEEVMRVLKGLDEEAVVIGELVDRPTLTDPRV
ncbi:Phosphoribosylformylglycinamidine cyclo-ligase, putative, partial [Perkinsus marinus ATCC 50983]